MKKIIISVVAVIFVIAAIAATVFLVRQRQDIRKQASVPGGQATVSVSPATETHPVGESFPVTIKFNSAGIFVATIATRLQYSNTTASQVAASNIQISDALLTGDWMCPVKTVTTEGDMVNIDIACANTSPTGFSSSADTDLATFNLVANQTPATNPVVLSFDPTQSKIKTKADGQDILLIPTSTGSYTISGGASPSPTPTPPGGSPTPTPTPGVDSSPTPTPTPSGSPAVTPTPTPAGRGGTTASPTPTPTPATSIASSTTITAPPTGSTVAVDKPTFAGKTLPGATITITINSPTITANITADANGNWSYTPVSDLGDGNHTVSILAKDPNTGQTTTKTASFVIAAGGGQAATNAGEIVSGNSLPTVFLLIGGLVLLILSFAPKIL